jgi:hypothetical protein
MGIVIPLSDRWGSGLEVTWLTDKYLSMLSVTAVEMEYAQGNPQKSVA